jgi:hypothetical protein
VTKMFASTDCRGLMQVQGTRGTPGTAGEAGAIRPRRPWYHFGTGCIVHYGQIARDPTSTFWYGW